MSLLVLIASESGVPHRSVGRILEWGSTVDLRSSPPHLVFRASALASIGYHGDGSAWLMNKSPQILPFNETKMSLMLTTQQ